MLAWAGLRDEAQIAKCGGGVDATPMRQGASGGAMTRMPPAMPGTIGESVIHHHC